MRVCRSSELNWGVTLCYLSVTTASPQQDSLEAGTLVGCHWKSEVEQLLCWLDSAPAQHPTDHLSLAACCRGKSSPPAEDSAEEAVDLMTFGDFPL